MRVLIADDSVLLRQGLALILAEGGHEVGGRCVRGTGSAASCTGMSGYPDHDLAGCQDWASFRA